ncbi:MFS transporter [Streptomyces sp. NPDC058718]|uniref:MFS transporter n=1 Tax=Streptomyces sp. NPDC058718 TaxID=3346610 RepID=UPI0036777F4F
MTHALHPGSGPGPGSASASIRRRQFWAASSLFAVMGFHTGAWTVLLVDLSHWFGLDLQTLGTFMTLACVASVPVQLAGGWLSDHFGRRPLLFLGLVGMGLTLTLLTVARSDVVAFSVFALMGLFGGILDLGVNSIGSDYESHYDVPVMTQLHAGFSGGAIGGALFVALGMGGLGWDFRIVYGIDAVLLMAFGVFALLLPLSGRVTKPDGKLRGGFAELRKLSVVLPASLLLALYFFSDSAIENFSSLYLRDLLKGGVVVSAVGVAGFYFASFVGRLCGSAIIGRHGEALLVRIAGLGMFAGIILIVTGGSPAVAAAGLLLFGLSEAPVAPVGFSLAGRATSDRAGLAMAVVSAISFGAYSLSPLAFGVIASGSSYQVAFSTLAGTALLIFFFGFSRKAGLSGAAPVFTSRRQ